MALNLGVKPQKPAVAGPVPSMEELFDAYMDVESVVRATDLFLQKGQQIEDAFENLCIVGSALKKHASAEGLAVVKDIVRNELGTEVSVEAFKEKAKAALSAIGEFFKKIGIWIKEFFARVLNFVLRADKRIEAAINAVKALPSDAKLEWSYTGLDVLGHSGYTIETVETVDEVTKNLAAYWQADNSDGGPVDTKGGIKKEHTFWNDKIVTSKVSGRENTLKVLEAARNMVKTIPVYKQAIEKIYRQAQDDVKKAGGASDETKKRLKEVQKRTKGAVSAVHKECAAYSRTIASIITHVPMKAAKEK